MSKNKSLAARAFHSLVPRSLKPKIYPYGMLLRLQIHKLLNGYRHPFSIDLETNASCTRKCSYCPTDPKNKTQLDMPTIRSVVDQLREWKFKGIIYPSSYNEPLADKRIVSILEHICKNLPEARVSVNTNGDLLTSELVGKLNDIGVASFNVSLHEPLSPQPEKRLRLISAMYSNVYLVDMRDGRRLFSLFNRAGSVDVGPIKKLPGCFMVDRMTIRADGNVVLCCNDYRKEVILGNVKETSLREIWNEPEYRKLRRRIWFGRYELPICKRCGHEARPNTKLFKDIQSVSSYGQKRMEPVYTPASKRDRSLAPQR